MAQNKPQTVVRESVVCRKCGALDSFRAYCVKGNITYSKCRCGQTAVVRTVRTLKIIR